MRCAGLLLSVLLFSSSCALPDLSSERLLLSFPEPPPSWAFLGLSSFRVRWRDASGLGREAVVEAGGKLEVSVRRGGFQALLAYPEGRGRGLAPAGALYPEGLEARDPYGLEAEPRPLGLSWAGGWLASVCSRLEAGGLEPEGFDLGGLARLAEAGDPWLAEPGAVALRLSEGRFRSSLVSGPTLFTVALPGPGPWAPESPLAPAPRAATGEAAAGEADSPFEAELPEGCHLFVGLGESLLVSVDGKGSSCLVRRPRQAP
jgi:hypothetical protein